MRSNARRVDSLFATPMYVADDGVQALRSRLLRHTRALERRDPRGAAKSNQRGWHSSGNLFDDEAPVIAELGRGLRAHVDRFLRRLSGRRGRFAFDLYGWINVSRRGAFNSRHIHPNSFLSGAHYVQVPAGMKSGEFVVWDPRGPKTIMHGLFYEELRFPWNQQWTKVEVRSGRTVLFPAWLEHEVAPLDEDVERISVAFNVYRRA